MMLHFAMMHILVRIINLIRQLVQSKTVNVQLVQLYMAYQSLQKTATVQLQASHLHSVCKPVLTTGKPAKAAAVPAWCAHRRRTRQMCR